MTENVPWSADDQNLTEIGLLFKTVTGSASGGFGLLFLSSQIHNPPAVCTPMLTRLCA